MGSDLFMADVVVDEDCAYATPVEFDRMYEYSTSLPTGTTIGKRWKRLQRDADGTNVWWMGEYIEDADPKMVGIKWRKLLVYVDDLTELQRVALLERSLR